MNTEYKCVTTVDGIRDYIGDSRIVAFDFETAPDDPYREEDKAALGPARAHIVGCSFSVKEGTGIYVPIAHRVGTNQYRQGRLFRISDGVPHEYNDHKDCPQHCL